MLVTNMILEAFSTGQYSKSELARLFGVSRTQVYNALRGHLRISYIYGLCDPETGQVRYVGKTDNTQGRFARHIADVKLLGKRSSAKEQWIASLLDRDMKPDLVILETIEDSRLVNRKEQEWIKKLSATGLLTNRTEMTSSQTPHLHGGD